MHRLDKDEWHILPLLNKPRKFHASTSIKSNVFVIGGFADYGIIHRSIEVLKLNDLKVGWQLFNANNLPRIDHLIACPIDDKRICIVGGTKS